MNVVTENNRIISITHKTGFFAGSCLQGYIYATRNELLAVYGAVTENDGYKVFFNFAGKIKFQDGNIISTTVYDWKYDAPVALDEKIKWNIGGYSRDAVDAVEQALVDTGLTRQYLNATYAL